MFDNCDNFVACQMFCLDDIDNIVWPQIVVYDKSDIIVSHQVVADKVTTLSGTRLLFR